MGIQKSLKESKIVENEKVALSLRVLGTTRQLSGGPGGPSDCIFTVFFARLLRGLKVVESGWERVKSRVLGLGRALLGG